MGSGQREDGDLHPPSRGEDTFSDPACMGVPPGHTRGPRHTASWVHLLYPPLMKRDWGDLQCDGDAAEQLLPSLEGQEGMQRGVVLPYVQRGGLQAALGEGLDWTPRRGPSIQMDHSLPKMSLGWSRRMLSPSLGLGSCAGRQDVCHPSFTPTHSPRCQVPRLAPED